jgi:hypothetical protein
MYGSRISTNIWLDRQKYNLEINSEKFYMSDDSSYNQNLKNMDLKFSKKNRTTKSKNGSISLLKRKDNTKTKSLA